MIAEIEAERSRRAPGSIIAPKDPPAPKVLKLAGLVEAEAFTGTKTRRAIVNQANVSRDFAVLREGDRPKIVRPILSLVAGIAMIAGWRKLAGLRLVRPEPKPRYDGPPLEPAVMLAHTQMIAGTPPRDISAYDDLLLPMPGWLRRSKDDPLREIYQVQRELLMNGRIVWGNIVQANALLFAPGADDHPAAIIYSPDPYYDANPEELDEIAGLLFTVKGATTSPELAEFSRILSDEVTRAMRLAVPRELTGGREVVFTSIVVRRLDLPDGRLAAGSFPLLVLPQHTACTLIVPWEWWSPALVALWRTTAEGRLG